MSESAFGMAEMAKYGGAQHQPAECGPEPDGHFCVGNDILNLTPRQGQTGILAEGGAQIPTLLARMPLAAFVSAPMLRPQSPQSYRFALR